MLHPLHPLHLRDLLVDSAAPPPRPPHLSSASGLAQAGRFLYVVADDEHHLGVMDAATAGPLRLHRLLGGELPAAGPERKRRKPDFEVLATLPSAAAWPQGALLALGSGSTAQRERGLLLPLHGDGSLANEARPVDLAPLYAPLRERFADLNIEGGFVAGGGFHLLQRADQGSLVNACIGYPLDAFTGWLAGAQTKPPDANVTVFDLGQDAGVPFGFTDATANDDGGWIFSAVAEATRDSYADGTCAASAIGWVSAGGVLQGLLPLAGAPKVEGVVLAAPGRLLLVTDADDPRRPSQLLQLHWPPAVGAR